MTTTGKFTFVAALALICTLTFAMFSSGCSPQASLNDSSSVSSTEVKSYIVQGSDPQKLVELVENAGGNVNKQFPIINAVSASMTSTQVEQIKKTSGVRISDDREVRTMASSAALSTMSLTPKSPVIDTLITKQVEANRLHNMGITGRGVTVAVIDSGANYGGPIGSYLFNNTMGQQRALLKYDALAGQETYWYNDDNNGHGSHVSGIIASSLSDGSGTYNGIAPDVFLLSIKAFDATGGSTYSHILDALNWIEVNQHKYRIRVVNMSLGAQANSRYWDDPINQAVMRLWHQGITVVTSAGNNGESLGITVPGNNPYVITVGASTHNDTPFFLEDDRVASFSAKGPTYEGFVKPDIVAPGTKIAVKLDSQFFAQPLRASETGLDYSVISGTSQSSAVVAGIAALIMQAHPGIRPDDVKCKLIAAAKVARKDETYAYSPLQQGSGAVNAFDAVTSTATNCSNQGLDIVADLTGTGGFYGPVSKQGDEFSIQLSNGKVLSHGAHWGTEILALQGAHWGEETFTLQGAHWSEQIISIEGAHWGNLATRLQGSHWSNESLKLHGGHWGDESLMLLGTDSNTHLQDLEPDASNDNHTGEPEMPAVTWQ
ncbi:S8 family peptidase [Glaciecola sp. XM2]|jgi:serine protease AprX|uniref:S8 family peptidase n=1 Tax=Glaciecola sp. XM2 TaxID=1914931 RepID=UPI001BDE32A3|nr:S8 family peptidase [Glaciecola sp. XM2]MBT1451649.1 S8 family peptidase [Glaciecola sp. XM2]